MTDVRDEDDDIDARSPKAGGLKITHRSYDAAPSPRDQQQEQQEQARVHFSRALRFEINYGP